MLSVWSTAKLIISLTASHLHGVGGLLSLAIEAKRQIVESAISSRKAFALFKNPARQDASQFRIEIEQQSC